MAVQDLIQWTGTVMKCQSSLTDFDALLTGNGDSKKSGLTCLNLPNLPDIFFTLTHFVFFFRKEEKNE